MVLHKKMLIFFIAINWTATDGLQAQTIEDIEGNVYHTIEKRSQVWMVENLKTTRFNDSSKIQLVEDGSAWEATHKPAYCWLNNDEKENRSIGAIYNWYAVATGKLCPKGWHVPSDKVFLEEATFPSGRRSYDGHFGFDYQYSCFWTSTEESSNIAYYTSVPYVEVIVNRGYTLKNSGLLVRCIKDQ